MKLNGEKIKDQNIKTLKELIVLYDFNLKSIATMVNGKIIQREEWENYKLAADDDIEIIGFVGGG